MLSYLMPCFVEQCVPMVEQEVMRTPLTAGSEVKVPLEQRESKLVQVKRLLTGKLHSSRVSSPPPAELPANMCITTSTTTGLSPPGEEKPDESKPRKRKERHESIGSISQERKVVRHTPHYHINNNITSSPLYISNIPQVLLQVDPQ